MAIITTMIVQKSTRFGLAVDTRLLDDVDSMAAALGDGLEGECVQLESRSFRGRWTTVRTPSLVAQFGTHEVAVARRVRVPADRCAFMVPLAVPAAARWNGHIVRSDDIIVCPPRSECLAFDPPSTRFAILTVDPTSSLLRAAANAGGPVAVGCGAEARALGHRLARVRDAVESGPVVGLSEADVSLETLLRACLERPVAAPPDLASICSRSRIVRRAEEFFRTHVSEGVSVAQLSSVTGVSERSLRNAFYDVYTTSPKRYMKLWQLHQVRRALRSSDAGAATVTEAATCLGFYELGRFAGAYKSLFGEAPSETLSRARRQQAMQGAA